MFKRVAIIIITLSFVFAAEAKTSKTATYEFPAGAFTTVEIDHPVGELDIVAGDAEKIRVQMRVECSSRRNRCAERVEDIELKSRELGSALELRIDGYPRNADSLSVNLEITMPRRLSVDIDRGVGETRIRDIEGDISVESGVGEVHIIAPVRSVGEVQAECGVGEANLRAPGGQIETEGFLFLGNELRWRGEGQSVIEVEAGVGSVKIDLE